MQEIKHNLGSSEASAEASLSYFHKIFGQMEIKEVEGEEEAHVPRFEVAFKLFSQLEKLRMGPLRVFIKFIYKTRYKELELGKLWWLT